MMSVLEQTHRDWSLVIVDDGSDDDPASVVDRIPDDRISFLRQSNAGVSAARNTGLRSLAYGRAVDAYLFLDGDDWLAPHALATLADTLESAPWAVAACGRYARIGLDGSQRLSPAPPGGNLLERLVTRNLFANGGHILIRAEAAETAGHFREDLSYGED